MKVAPMPFGIATYPAERTRHTLDSQFSAMIMTDFVRCSFTRAYNTMRHTATSAPIPFGIATYPANEEHTRHSRPESSCVLARQWEGLALTLRWHQIILFNRLGLYHKSPDSGVRLYKSKTRKMLSDPTLRAGGRGWGWDFRSGDSTPGEFGEPYVSLKIWQQKLLHECVDITSKSQSCNNFVARS